MSNEVGEDMACLFLTFLEMGLYQHEVAAIFDVNQGRVSEVKNKLRCELATPLPVITALSRMKRHEMEAFLLFIRLRRIHQEARDAG